VRCICVSIEEKNAIGENAQKRSHCSHEELRD
jgi:hypothetical protein